MMYVRNVYTPENMVRENQALRIYVRQNVCVITNADSTHKPKLQYILFQTLCQLMQTQQISSLRTVKVKVKLNIERTTKAQIGNRCISLLFL